LVRELTWNRKKTVVLRTPRTAFVRTLGLLGHGTREHRAGLLGAGQLVPAALAHQTAIVDGGVHLLTLGHRLSVDLAT